MSGTSTPTERDARLLEIGKQCSSPTCHLIDFLPFTCQHCAHPFCGEHFLPEAHKCDKYDATKHDRVAPSCEWLDVFDILCAVNNLFLRTFQALFATHPSRFHQDRTQTSAWRGISTRNVQS